MASSIYNSFGKQLARPNNPMEMFKQFMQFKKSIKGDPKAQVQQLINSGAMTQEQYQQLSGMANDFKNLFGIK